MRNRISTAATKLLYVFVAGVAMAGVARIGQAWWVGDGSEYANNYSNNYSSDGNTFQDLHMTIKSINGDPEISADPDDGSILGATSLFAELEHDGFDDGGLSSSGGSASRAPQAYISLVADEECTSGSVEYEVDCSNYVNGNSSIENASFLAFYTMKGECAFTVGGAEPSMTEVDRLLEHLYQTDAMPHGTHSADPHVRARYLYEPADVTLAIQLTAHGTWGGSNYEAPTHHDASGPGGCWSPNSGGAIVQYWVFAYLVSPPMPE